MTKFKIALLLTFTFAVNLVNAQVPVTFTAGGTITIDCGEDNPFADGFGGTYTAGLSDTLTICSDGVNGLATSLLFNEITGYWDVHESDTLFIYDGPDATAPLLGGFNVGNSPNGLSVSSTLDNLTGCLTLVFVSDGADEAQGFSGVAVCGFDCQPINPFVSSIPSLSSDTTIDICLGDTVWLSADGEFPLSSANNGPGYNQTLANSSVEWLIAGVGSFSGPDIFFVPTQNAGYYVNLLMTDTLNCFEDTLIKVRVSTVPSYLELAASVDDTLCINQSGIILGGINAISQDTVGVDPTQTEYIIGGLFSDQLELPDGATGTLADIYTTVISINGAQSTDEITTGSDLVNICMDIEHSYVGDLEMWITCPNGDSALLFDGYNGWSGPTGFFPGGFPTQTGIDLGEPILAGTDPGVCWSYCFSITENNFQSFEDEYAGMTGSMTSGTYLPEQSFDELIGCPINGDWQLRVADNFGGDNGYICQWSIEFIDGLSPEAEYYSPRIVDGWWENDPTIVNFLGDTAIEVLPPGAGTYGYTFTVEDNFGCSYDTTVNVTVVPPHEVLGGLDQESCMEGQTFIEVINSRDGGEWRVSGPGSVTYNPDEFSLNPEITVSEEGEYWATFIDSYCETSDSVNITIADDPDVSVFADTNRICDAHTLDIGATAGTSIFTGGNDLTWSPSNFVGAPFVADATDPNHYFQTDPTDSTQVSVTVSATNYCGTSSADFPFEIVECIVVTPSIFNPNSNIADNAYFQISGLALHVGNNVKIFDRWGRKCYDVDNYHLNPWRGEKEADGVYYWVLERPGYDPEVGYVHLVHGSGS